MAAPFGTSETSFRSRLTALALAAVAIVSVTPATSVSAAAPITVTSAADPGDGTCTASECTLREAIVLANAQAGTDTITFAIATGPATITPATALPAVTAPVAIDGSTQPGFSGTPLIAIDGALIRAAVGLRVQGGASTLRALALGNFTDGDAVTLEIGGGNLVVGCHIGTDAAGLVARPNRKGITVLSAGNTIGGTAAGDRNVISGNFTPAHNLDSFGVQIKGAAAGDNVVIGNHVGVGADGTTHLANGVGIAVSEAPRPVIGGTAPGAGNLVAGNLYNGIRLVGTAVTDAVIQGNVVGLDAAGAPLGSRDDAAVRIKKARNPLIGGSTPGAGNIIASSLYGIRITERASGVRIIGNRIGTDATGTLNRGNTRAGILTQASKLTVGGETAGEANTIAFNGAAGVAVSSGGPVKISANRMFSNGGLGIDLGTAGVTPNDASDSDAGGNGLQNSPAITSVQRGASSTQVGITLGSAASKTYRIQLYASATCDSSTYGEGARFLGAATVTTASSGQAAATLTVGVVSTGEVVTATAADPAGSTSEFSRCVTAV